MGALFSHLMLRRSLILGALVPAMLAQAACTETDEEITTEELVGDALIEQEVDQQAQTLEEAADEAVKIMEEDIAVTPSTPLQQEAAAIDE
jgi:hypothetical protein